MPIWGLIAVILGFIFSAIPLYLAIKFLGGKTSFLKTLFVSFIAGIIIGAIRSQFQVFGGLLAFFVLIWIYHEAFRLRWLKAVAAWLLQGLFVLLFYIIVIFIIAATIGLSALAIL